MDHMFSLAFIQFHVLPCAYTENGKEVKRKVVVK